MKLSSGFPVTEEASSKLMSMISPVFPCNWLSGLRSLSSMSLTWSPFWKAWAMGYHSVAWSRSFSWVRVEMSCRRSTGFIWANAFLYRLTVSRETSSSSAVCVWFIRVIVSTYFAVVSFVSEYLDSISSTWVIFGGTSPRFTTFTCERINRKWEGEYLADSHFHFCRSVGHPVFSTYCSRS